MAKYGFLTSICSICKGEYDGVGISVGQTIQCPHCGRVIEHSPKFGDFLLRRQAGEGGMCTVYLADDLKHKRVVALKLLNKTLAKDVESVLRFFDEAETTGIFKHPNIIEMYEFGDYNGKLFLSMEYLPGGSLDGRMLKMGRLPELDCLEIGISAANGLAYAAKQGVVHRDIKPGNILFKSDGEATVADFGLCFKTSDPNPNTKEIWGTAYYVPPERLFGETEDFRSDMYGLAATLFHAMAGRAAFEPENPDDPVLTHEHDTVVRIQSVYPEISDKTAYAIDKAMSFNLRDRFQSYEEFIARLKDAKRTLQDHESKMPKSKTSIMTALKQFSSWPRE